jgi:hypothetical protein
MLTTLMSVFSLTDGQDATDCLVRQRVARRAREGARDGDDSCSRARAAMTKQSDRSTRRKTSTMRVVPIDCDDHRECLFMLDLML